MVNNSAKTKDSLFKSDEDLGRSGKFGSQIFAGYSHSFGNTLNLAANVFYGLGSNKISDANSMTVKKVRGLSVEPGVYLGDKTLAYAKLGVAKAQLKAFKSDSANINGFLYGFGLKHMVTSNVFVGAEFQKIDFRKRSFDTTTVDPVQTYSGVTVGYKF
jgi:opacity protein-like surface antigen